MEKYQNLFEDEIDNAIEIAENTYQEDGLLLDGDEVFRELREQYFGFIPNSPTHNQ